MDDVFKPLWKYRIESEVVSGDGVSNVIIIERRYRIPWWSCWNRGKVLDDFYAFDDKEFHFEDIGIRTHVLGWGDYDCRTIDMLIVCVPNGDNIVYNSEIDMLNEIRGKSVS